MWYGDDSRYWQGHYFASVLELTKDHFIFRKTSDKWLYGNPSTGKTTRKMMQVLFSYSRSEVLLAFSRSYTFETL